MPDDEAWRSEKWRLLAEFEVRRDEAAGWYGLTSCADCSGGEQCRRKAWVIPPLNFEHWPACPVSLLRSAAWQYVISLYNARQVAPLAGWPQRYAAWVVDALTALHAAVEAKQAAELKQGGR